MGADSPAVSSAGATPSASAVGTPASAGVATPKGIDKLKKGVKRAAEEGDEGVKRLKSARK